MKIGQGYDLHRLIPKEKCSNKELLLGGIVIPFTKSLEGHSDADVLIHAIIDSLLGAASLGDIGDHFPPSDDKYKNADSLVLLKAVKKLLDQKNFKIINIDSTVIAEAPKLGPHKKEMQKKLAETLALDIEQVNVKATTTEGLGEIGKEEAIAAMAVSLLE